MAFSTDSNDTDGIRCDIRCKTEWDLEYHVQAAHTEDGLRKKMHSETKLAEFLDSKNCAYDRDRTNHVSFTCKPSLKLSGRCSYPDFYLTEISARLGAHVILGNDEFSHRRYPCDLRRTIQLATAIAAWSDGMASVPLIYIRFNPHYFTIGNTLFDVSLEKAHEKLWDIVQNLHPPTNNGLNLIYVQYDRVNTTSTNTSKWEQLLHFTQIDEKDINYENSLLVRDCVVGVF
jgi:hypothetical protein